MNDSGDGAVVDDSGEGWSVPSEGVHMTKVESQEVEPSSGVDRDLHPDPEENRNGEAAGCAGSDDEPIGPTHR